MIFTKFLRPSLTGKIALAAGVLALAGCASEDIDDTTGSHLAQPQVQPGAPPEPSIEAGDIAIAAQQFSHSIRELPQVANDTTPALVRFTGVTSIVKDKNKQLADIDTAPYTTLLRDRLLLGDREKLRFVERQLPPLSVPHKKGHHDDDAPTGDIGTGDPDYQVLAELRGRVDAGYYRIQMEFVEIHSGSVLLNQTFRIRAEASDSGGEQISDQDVPPQPVRQAAPQDAPVTPLPRSADGNVPPVPGVDDNSVPAQRFNPPPPPQ